MKLPELQIIVKRKEDKENTTIYKISNSKDAYSFFKEIFDSDTILWKEEFAMICLSRNNQVIGFYKVSSGGTTASVVDTKIVCQISLLSLAHSVILAHNHPSGSSNPSEEDLEITQQIIEVGKQIDIKVLDHVIIGDDFWSWVENRV